MYTLFFCAYYAGFTAGLKEANKVLKELEEEFSHMKNGLYRVDQSHGICAGFVVRGGQVVVCAPILRKRLSYWYKFAHFVCD